MIYLRSAIRSLKRDRTYSFLNIAGLGVGMAACIVILLFVYYERSFDSLHHKDLYRLNEVTQFPGMAAPEKEALTMFPMGPTLKAEFPEVLNFSRVQLNNDYEMTYGEKRLFLPQTYFVDSAFLRMFDFPLIEGDRQTALQKPNSIVLTESTAKQLFGTADPVGRTVAHFGADTLLYTVTGILKDVPSNSQFQFAALQSFNTVSKPDWADRWNTNWLNTYLELAPNADRVALEKKFPAYLKKHLGNNAKYYGLFLLTLKDVHANGVDIGSDDINYQKFDQRYTDIFMGIGLLVLLIACINFMNLATAQSAERGKEVGVRKSIGASRAQLGIQFLVETVLFSLIALVLAFGLVNLVLPYIEKLSGRELRPIFFQHPGLLVAVFIGTILVGLLSGLYPAIYLSSFQPVQVLKGDTGKRKSVFRSILVVGQFSSAIFLIIATVLVYRQVNYIMKQDPGFDRDEVVTIHLDGLTSKKYNLLKQELSANPEVKGVTGAWYQLGSELTTLGVGYWPANGPMRTMTATAMFVDPDYLRLYKINLAAGQNFSREKAADGREFIINETLARDLLKDEPGAPLSSLIGRHFGGDTTGSIVGVARDFNFNSLHYKIEPLFLFNQSISGFNRLSVKINGHQTGQAIAFIQSTWKQIFPGYPFKYEFLDDHFKEVYKTDAQVSRMVAIMAGLAIFISCLGLFGLASFSAERRTKEIGIRKVLGASIENVVFLLSKHFIGLVLIANLIAVPLAWLALNKWMQGYAYRVSVSWWVFVLAGAAALVIALATVSFHAIKAALANPVKTLRTE